MKPESTESEELKVNTVISSPLLDITPGKTFYNQGDVFNIECELVDE